MPIEEIYDWMSYERSISKDFLKKQKEKAEIAKTKEAEAEAVRRLFASIQSSDN